VIAPIPRDPKVGQVLEDGRRVLEVVGGVPILSSRPRTGLRVGELVRYEGRVHRVDRVGGAGAVLVPVEKTFHEVVATHQTVVKDVKGRRIRYRVPLDEPEVKQVPDRMTPVTVAAGASLERVRG
jgi:hypothetical protein